MSSIESPYSQAPLDLSGSSFRLVELQPCGPSDIIKCRLTTHPLPPDCPSYVALSYMWDHVSQKDIIELNEVPFQVGHSLWTFLNQMRLHQKFGQYWIDALCIDQSNVQERNHQVQLMRCIYSKAESVSIWLGAAEEGSLKAEAMILLASLRHDSDTFQDWTIKQRVAIKKFCEDEYWNRMWIVQEVVLARTAIICCGLHIVDFSRLTSLMSVVRTYERTRFPGIVLSPADIVCECVKFLASPWNNDKFARAILACENRKATDARDKIYALLSMLEEEALSIPVDYNITAEALWEVVFSYVCRTIDRGRDLLYTMMVGRSSAEGMGISIADEMMWDMVNKIFLPRAPPDWVREVLDLPDAPNQAVFFETRPAEYNPKGSLADLNSYRESMRTTVSTQADRNSEHE